MNIIRRSMIAAATAIPLAFSSVASFASDIVDTAVSAGKFQTLVTAVKAAGLVDTLKGDGPFTVFAPTDEAFAKLPAGTVEDLLKPENKEKLVAVLTYHVVPGTARFDRLGPARNPSPALQLRRAHDQQQVATGAFCEIRDDTGTGDARLARGHAQFDDALLREQRQVRAGYPQLLPVESAGRDIQVALRETAFACRAADRIGRFGNQQMLVATDQVAGSQIFLQGGCELPGLDLQPSCSMLIDSPSSNTGIPFATGYRTLPSSVTSASVSGSSILRPSAVTSFPVAIAEFTELKSAAPAGTRPLCVSGQRKIVSRRLSIVSPRSLWRKSLFYKCLKAKL